MSSEGEREKRKTDVPPSTYNVIGVDCTVSEDDDFVSFVDCRLKSLAGVEVAKNCTYLDVNTNFIEEMDPVSALPKLEHLDLYLNKIRRIRGLEETTNLKFLDLSFNAIRNIENLKSQTMLEKLFMPANKIEKVSVMVC